MKSGIYRISLINRSLYVGKSVDVIARIKVHQKELSKDVHTNRMMQRLYNTNSNFTYECLEMCPNDLLQVREQHYHNVYLPEFADDVPNLATATDEFKLMIFPRILGQVRAARFKS